jgi:cytochrome c biogenesis protein CcdA
MLGVIVDGKELWQTVVASLVAAVGVTASFSVLIFGAARYADLLRSDRPVAAAAAGVLALLALAVTIAAIVLGIIVMLSK